MYLLNLMALLIIIANNFDCRNWWILLASEWKRRDLGKTSEACLKGIQIWFITKHILQENKVIKRKLLFLLFVFAVYELDFWPLRSTFWEFSKVLFHKQDRTNWIFPVQSFYLDFQHSVCYIAHQAFSSCQYDAADMSEVFWVVFLFLFGTKLWMFWNEDEEEKGRDWAS